MEKIKKDWPCWMYDENGEAKLFKDEEIFEKAEGEWVDTPAKATGADDSDTPDVEELVDGIEDAIEDLEDAAEDLEDLVDETFVADDSMTVAELEEHCKECGLEGYSTLKKADLIKAINDGSLLPDGE